MYSHKNEPLLNEILMSLTIFTLALMMVVGTILKIVIAIIDLNIRLVSWAIYIYNSARDKRYKQLSIKPNPTDE